MPTEEKQMEKEKDSQRESRISPELENELKEKTLESESDFYFIKNMEEINDDLVRVRFETPFAGSVVTQEFVKPDAESDFDKPELEELYSEVGASISEPRSILDLSIPNDLEILDSATEKSMNENWIPSYIDLYEKEETSNIRKAEAGLSTVVGLGAAIFVFSGTIASALLSVTILVLGLFLAFALVNTEYKQPSESRRVLSVTEVSEGDILVLDKTPTTSEDDREVCRVVDAVDGSLEVMMRDGRTVGVSYDSRDTEWSIHHYDSGSPTVDDGYKKAFVIGKENL